MEFSFQDVVKVDWASDRGESPVMKDESMESPTTIPRSDIIEEQNNAYMSFTLDSTPPPADIAPAAEETQQEAEDPACDDLYGSIHNLAAIEDESGDSALEESALGPDRDSDTEQDGSWENSKVEEAIALARAQVATLLPDISLNHANRVANEPISRLDDEKVVFLCGDCDLYKKVAPVFSPHCDLTTYSSFHFHACPDLVVYVTDFCSLYRATTTGSLFDHADVAGPGKFLIICEEHEADPIKSLLSMSEVDYISGGKHGVWTVEEVSKWRPRDINRLLNKERAAAPSKNPCYFMAAVVAFFTAVIVGTLVGVSMCGGGLTSSFSDLSSFFERLERHGTAGVAVDVSNSTPDVLIQPTTVDMPIVTVASAATLKAAMTPLPEKPITLEEEAALWSQHVYQSADMADFLQQCMAGADLLTVHPLSLDNCFSLLESNVSALAKASISASTDGHGSTRIFCSTRCHGVLEHFSCRTGCKYKLNLQARKNVAEPQPAAKHIDKSQEVRGPPPPDKTALIPMPEAPRETGVGLKTNTSSHNTIQASVREYIHANWCRLRGKCRDGAQFVKKTFWLAAEEALVYYELAQEALGSWWDAVHTIIRERLPVSDRKKSQLQRKL
ncbi:hypothetical protein HDU87_005295 [Geranomyces variabilis]|uniref:Uncharacterized protein n=1 Tax=Geranomyces variabilis TaxID=109894 RepID=A0AAD5XPE3_9FUNG|nr:hypothetical protein HDU87_005295 [Geranomyces variabilis]